MPVAVLIGGAQRAADLVGGPVVRFRRYYRAGAQHKTIHSRGAEGGAGQHYLQPLDHYGITPVSSVGRSVETSAARFASRLPNSALRSALTVGSRVVNSVVSDAGP